MISQSPPSESFRTVKKLNKKTAKDYAKEYGKQDLGKYPKSKKFLEERKKDHSQDKDSRDHIIVEKGQFLPVKLKIEIGNPIDFLIEDNKETGILSLDSANNFGLKELNGYIRSKAIYLANINKLEWIDLNNQAVQKVVEVVKKEKYILKDNRYSQLKKYRWKVFKVARNEIYDILRKERKYPRGITFSEMLIEPIDPKQDIEKTYHTKTEKAEARGMLKGMKNKNFRQILIWKYADELSLKQIAEKLDITIDGVKGRIKRALEQIRKEYKNRHLS